MVEKGVVGSHEQRATAGQEAGASRRTILTVDVGCMTVTDDRSAVLQTQAIGSGIAVALYDPENGVGGMLHFLLPDGSVDEARRISQPALFADSGFEFLLQQMKTRGAHPEDLKCYLVGGADPIYLGITEPILSLGHRNAAVARELIEKANLSLTAMRTGGSRARRAVLEIATGTVRITETPAERRTVDPRG